MALLLRHRGLAATLSWKNGSCLAACPRGRAPATGQRFFRELDGGSTTPLLYPSVSGRPADLMAPPWENSVYRRAYLWLLIPAAAPHETPQILLLAALFLGTATLPTTKQHASALCESPRPSIARTLGVDSKRYSSDHHTTRHDFQAEKNKDQFS